MKEFRYSLEITPIYCEDTERYDMRRALRIASYVCHANNSYDNQTAHSILNQMAILANWMLMNQASRGLAAATRERLERIKADSGLFEELSGEQQDNIVEQANNIVEQANNIVEQFKTEAVCFDEVA